MQITKRLYAPKEVIVKNGGVLAISLSGVYAAISEGKIPTVKVGNRKLIPWWYLEKLLRKPDSVQSGPCELVHAWKIPDPSHVSEFNRKTPSPEVLAKY